MRVRPRALALLIACIALLVGGASLATWTELGTLGWALILAGVVLERVAVTRPRGTARDS